MSEYIVGRNACIELLKSESPVEKIFIQSGDRKGSILKIIAMAKEKGIILQEVSQSKLNEMAPDTVHQGVVALVLNYQFYSIADMLHAAAEKNEDPFLILLDGIEDPHNLGAIIRTAEAAGAHGVIIPTRRSATITSTVHKAAAGATTHMKIARVVNINNAIEKLKRAGVWIFGTDAEAKESYTEVDLKGPVALVIGSEGRGVSSLVKKNCDFLVKIPMYGKVNSLNASNAAALMIYEVLRNRNGAK